MSVSLHLQTSLDFITHLDNRNYPAMATTMAPDFTHRFLPATLQGFGKPIRDKEEFIQHVKNLEPVFEKLNVHLHFLEPHNYLLPLTLGLLLYSTYLHWISLNRKMLWYFMYVLNQCLVVGRQSVNPNATDGHRWQNKKRKAVQQRIHIHVSVQCRWGDLQRGGVYGYSLCAGDIGRGSRGCIRSRLGFDKIHILLIVRYGSGS